MIVGALFILMGVVMITGSGIDFIGLLITFGLGSFLIWLKGPLYKRGHVEQKIGFDWEQNIFWSQKGPDGKILWHSNANHIESIYLRPYIYETSDSDEEGGSDKVWQIVTKKNDSIDWKWVEIPDKKEAEALFAKAQSLLNQFQ